MPHAERHDLIVWGATGFTGRLVAEYLDDHAPEGLDWAIGGRDRGKLEALRDSLQAEPPLVVGDSLDPAAMAEVVGTTRVVASTVGPYAKYGTPLVDACVEAGIGYCDLTAEVPWIRRNIDQLHERAGKTGARVVHCCGFDSIPSDLGVWMLHRHLQQEHGRRLGGARFYLMKGSGGFSGGTIASILNLVEEASKSRDVRRLLGDPFALDPERSGTRPTEGRDPREDDREANRVRFDETIERWTAPFLMAGINTRVVRRTDALLGRPYDPAFRYAEVMACRSKAQARIVRTGLGGMIAAGSFAPGRGLLRGFLPNPGEGPDEEKRRRGFFEILIVGHAAGDPPVEVRARIGGDSDPGYAETSKMLAESALCLALDDLSSPGGVTTPAAALGDPLLQRLKRAGMTFEIVDSRV